MEIYLVGGAVRDRLLGLPIKDRDWVITGSTPEQMIADGFQPVGKDFPVFLHPKTHEEFALARTERKSGHGYHGFTFFADPSVTLEQDLIRRDLTINAMAEATDGKIVDPFNGQQDLEDRLLRHVSDAFLEDPLRLLRVARFAARLAPLGFKVADETMLLMQQISQSGELEHLTPERVWQETERALMEQQPEVFFEVLRQAGALKHLMPELDRLWGVPNPEKWHPEIDTGIHTMMVLQQAVLLGADGPTRFAALAHDFGKGVTPRKFWPSHRGHEEKGREIIEHFCKRLKIPNRYRDLAVLTSVWHTHAHRSQQLRPATILKLLEQTDALRRPARFVAFLIACEADAKGRTGLENNPWPQRDYLIKAQQAAATINAREIVAKGITGVEVGVHLHQARIDAIRQAISE